MDRDRGAGRLVDEFSLTTEAGSGTTVVLLGEAGVHRDDAGILVLRP